MRKELTTNEKDILRFLYNVDEFLVLDDLILYHPEVGEKDIKSLYSKNLITFRYSDFSIKNPFWITKKGKNLVRNKLLKKK